jgi:hypothetical protein
MSLEKPNGADGEVPETATIELVFNPTLQMCQVKFDSQEYKTWDMVLAVIEMAKNEALFRRQVAITANLQAQAINAHQAREVTREVLRGKH